MPEKQHVIVGTAGHIDHGKSALVKALTGTDPAPAADDGVAVQTREHFDILRLLGIKRGLIALAKSDLVDRSRLDEVEREVRNFVAGTFLEAAPVIPVSAVTGDGIDELKAALMAIRRQVGLPEDSGIFRLPIDRVFTVHGFGTVMAGTA